MAEALTDTIAVSDSLVREFTRQAAYDYKRELVQTDTNYLESFLRWLNNFFSNMAYDAVYKDDYSILWWIGGAIVIVLLLAWLMQTRFALFRRRDGGSPELDYDVELESIHDIDFDTCLAEARQAGDHRQVCRLLYLQTLKRLSDSGLVEWQPFKTPSQYARELADPAMRSLTNTFLRVRYGNFLATAGLCQQMLGWQQQVLALIPVAEQKGGEPS